jgi:hypothetical protein
MKRTLTLLSSGVMVLALLAPVRNAAAGADTKPTVIRGSVATTQVAQAPQIQVVRAPIVTEKLVRVPTGHASPTVDVWTSEGDGALVHPGEAMKVFFRTNRDAYVIVVDIDTRGRASLLFPARQYDDGFVRGRRTVALPERGAPYKLQVTGPAGVERIVAFASDEPLTGQWRRLVAEEAYRQDRDLSDGRFGDGRFEDGRFERSSTTLWNATATVLTDDLGVTVAAGNRSLQEKLVRVPVNDACDFTMAETWFRVAPGRFGRRY